MEAWDNYGASVLEDRNNWQETDILFAYLTQKWNDKWTTFERYLTADITGVNDNTTNWTFGVRYQHTPAIMFELAYDKLERDAVQALAGGYADDDHLVRLRTWVKF